MKVINNIPYLSQRDPAWASILLGSGNLTVGRYGCLTTCLSMASAFFGCYSTPGMIAQVKSNYSGSEIVWIQLDFPTFSFRWREGSLMNNAENKINMDMIRSYLDHDDNRPEDNDRCVLLEVANRSHWVLGLWQTFDGDILAIDPAKLVKNPKTGKWESATCKVYETYGNITGAALLVRWDKSKHGGKQAWQGKMSPVGSSYD